MARPAVLAAALAGAALACKAFSPDFDAVIAIEVTLPDSGRVEIGDTLHPAARALNGRGDSVAATLVWSALDTTIAVLDSATGSTVGLVAGKTGRLVVRADALRSNPATVTVLAPLDSITVSGATRDTVAAPDTLSDSLQIHAFSATSASARRIVLTIDFPPGAPGLTLMPKDTVRTNGSGIAVFQVRLTGARPDSAVVTARAQRADGSPVPGSPLTFVVEFLP
jgi:hypothetical protein